jgi:uncharacterized protein (TIGR00297 family)
VNALFGLAALYVHAVSPGGFFAGILIGAAAYYSFGVPGFVLLGLFFISGTFFSRFGYKEKKLLGVAQADYSRRSARHVWGKGFAAFVSAVAAVFSPVRELAALGFVTAVATSLYDTTATELGQLYGKRPFLITTLRHVPRGTPGAVSPAGSLFGLAAAAVLTAIAYAVGLTTMRGLAWSLMSATIGTHLEGYLAARPVSAKTTGPMLNAFHTAAAMLLAVVLGGLIGI